MKNIFQGARGWRAIASTLCVSLGLLTVLPGCQGAGGGEASTAAINLPTDTGSSNGETAAPPAGNVTPGDPSTPGTPTGVTPVVGESCRSSDTHKQCLAMHFVIYKDANGVAAASPTQAATIVHTMNQLFAQCDIGFEIEKYDVVDPTAYGLVYGAASQSQLDQIRGTFDSPSDELLGVTTGPWGTAVNGWTNMPGDNVYGAIMEKSIVGYGGGIIYAHEFGHYLGLDHVSSNANLMSPIIYTNSTTLTSSQCANARNTVNSYWSAMLRVM